MIRKKFVIIVSFILLFISFSVLFANKKSGRQTFLGRVIYIADDFIELKKGKVEITVYFSDSTKFMSMDGAEGGKSIIEICQVARAFYVVEGVKNVLNKIIVTRESDCLK